MATHAYAIAFALMLCIGFMFQILSVRMVKTYCKRPWFFKNLKIFRRNKIHPTVQSEVTQNQTPKILSLQINALLFGPAWNLLVAGSTITNIHDPNLYFETYVYKPLFALTCFSFLVIQLQVGLTWMDVLVNSGGFQVLKNKKQVVSRIVYCFALLQMVAIFSLFGFNLRGEVMSAAMGFLGIIPVSIVLVFGSLLSTKLMRYGVEGSDTHIAGQRIQKTVRIMIAIMIAYMGSAAGGTLTVSSDESYNALYICCLALVLLYKTAFLFYCDSRGLFFKQFHRMIQNRVTNVIEIRPQKLQITEERLENFYV